jgi:hypothetical protein
MILPGEAKVDKKVLEELASRPEDEISTIALGIEEGTYKKNAVGHTPEGSGSIVDLIMTGMKSLEKMVRKISDGIDSGLAKTETQKNRAVMKTTLRSYIDKLEDLYMRM